MIILFLILVFLGPRFGTLVWWLVSPARFNLAFSTYIFPLLGLIFVPWTTLMYVAVYAGGITGWDWLWMGFALFADISSYGSGAYKATHKSSTEAPKKVEGSEVIEEKEEEIEDEEETPKEV